MLDAHQLNVFLLAAETLSFTEAARRLHMSQPSVSQHIQSLERHFEQPLFARLGRHIELTDAGKTLLPLARDFVKRSIYIDETMQSLQGEVFGHLLVGCSTTPGKYILPYVLARFHSLYPKVTVACQVMPEGQAIKMARNGDIHFVMAGAPYLSGGSLEFRKYVTDPVVLIAPLDHLWAQRDEIEPEELYDADFIFREPESGTQVAVSAQLAEMGLSQDLIRTLLVLGNSEAIALAVEEGLGVGFISSTILNRLVYGRVARVNVRGMNLEREIYIGRHKRQPASVAQSVFWEFLIHEKAPNLLEPVKAQMVEK